MLAELKVVANIDLFKSRKGQAIYLLLFYPSEPEGFPSNLKIWFGFREKLQSALALLNQFQNINPVVNI